MAQASTVRMPWFVVVLLLWFSYHVFLPSAIRLEPPFYGKVREIIEQYGSPEWSHKVLVEDMGKTIDQAYYIQDKASPVRTKNTQPNPVAQDFPRLDSAVMNGTYAVIPIDYELARSIIPMKYGILTAGIHSLLPSLPRDQYPLLLSTGIIHDINLGGIHLSDYSFAEFRFPFVDLLGDGYSHFSYVPSTLVSEHPFGANVLKALGQESVVATFQPPDDPYAFVPADKAKQAGYYFNAYVNDISVLNTIYATRAESRFSTYAYTSSFYTNVTNQPYFSCNSADCDLTCGVTMTFFLTQVSWAEHSPRHVRGSVSLANSTFSGISIFPDGLDFDRVHGLKTAVSFVDNKGQNCSIFRGYDND